MDERYENNAVMTDDAIDVSDALKEQMTAPIKGLEDVESKKAAEKMVKDAEYDLVSSLIAAADFKTNDELIREVEIRRKGQYFFTVHLHPISDADMSFARKKATKMYDNPAGKKYPKIAGELNANLLNSWVIYLATTEEDKQKIWNNPAIRNKFMLGQPIESIDVLLMAGEKIELSNIVFDISGLSDDEDEEVDEEEYAKNL